MCLSSVAVLFSCDDDNGDGNKNDAFVIMTDLLDGLFNPFYATSGNDSTIVSMTQIGMITTGLNDKGEVVPAYGDGEAVAVKDYKEESVAGDTKYTFVLKNGITYSDGHPLTIEDVLFNMYVYLDPVYTGSSTMYSTDIKGLDDYRYQTPNATEENDDLVNEQARQRAKDRIQELINVYTEKKKQNSATGTVTNAEFEVAISSWSLSSGYKKAISTKPEEVTNENLLADYKLALKYFREELDRDFESYKDAFTEKPYKDWSEFEDDIFCFMFAEGFVEVEYGEKDGKPNADKSVITKLTKRYNDSITTKESAIEYVFNYTTQSKFDQILKYWATAQTLATEFAAKAKEVVLREKIGDEGLIIDSISGIKSLGHNTDITSVTIGDKTYTVAHEHNSDGTPKNAEEYDVLEITINGVDPKAIWNFAFAVAPQHYYGEGSSVAVDLTNNKFGVEFASFDFMTNKIQSQRNVKLPMGAGAYKVTDANNSDTPGQSDFYKNNVVYFKANDKFLLGTPKIEKVRYQVVSASNALQALEAGTVHYATPQLTKDNDEKLTAIAGQGFKTLQSDQLGYGYIGVSADKIPNIYLRRAIMSAMDIGLAIEYYKVGTANEIYFPMSTVSWAYPKTENSEGKLVPDQINGTNYPMLNFNAEDAKAQIKSYMEEAAGHAGGYNDSDLKVTFTIAGSNLTDHPTYSVFDTAAQLLNECGWDVTVIADAQALTKISTGSLAVWAAAWGTTVDPDMYQVYHKNSTASSVKAWGYPAILENEGGKYDIENDILDRLADKIDDAREITDRDERSAIYKSAMQDVLDLAVELPVYQRAVLYAYNSNVIKSSSLPSTVNPYTSPLDRIWEIEFAD